MKLRADRVADPHDARKREPVVAGSDDVGGVARLRIERVHEVELLSGHAAEERVVVDRGDGVPAHVWDGRAGRETAHPSGQHS
jgi:hypothetical protein